MMPAGVAKTDIMASERNWLDRLGPLPDADNDPLPTMVRNGFTAAAVEAIKTKRYLVCDDLDLLAEWSSHHVSQGLGEAPKWPL